ncbi:MAG: SRPBCC domain-containing protein [Spirosomataceae bacterium]
MAQYIEKTIHVYAPAAVVWEYLTRPSLILQWMGDPEMKLNIQTDWKVNSPIRISGFHPRHFENKGVVLQFQPPLLLQYTHLSSVSGLEDRPENHSVLTFTLTPTEAQTLLSLTLTQFPTEAIRKHLEFYWGTTLYFIKAFAEKQSEVQPQNLSTDS